MRDRTVADAHRLAIVQRMAGEWLKSFLCLDHEAQVVALARLREGCPCPRDRACGAYRGMIGVLAEFGRRLAALDPEEGRPA
jgi:hypothetical protein